MKEQNIKDIIKQFNGARIILYLLFIIYIILAIISNFTDIKLPWSLFIIPILLFIFSGVVNMIYQLSKIFEKILKNNQELNISVKNMVGTISQLQDEFKKLTENEDDSYLGGK